mmetsp:Transcript_130788/g.364497  ORF Transcript_130788/g.364497 Transcript_130788/m.364497 type:complete len:223 (+) Transcript_130788:632-1300(+)
MQLLMQREVLHGLAHSPNAPTQGDLGHGLITFLVAHRDPRNDSARRHLNLGMALEPLHAFHYGVHEAQRSGPHSAVLEQHIRSTQQRLQGEAVAVLPEEHKLIVAVGQSGFPFDAELRLPRIVDVIAAAIATHRGTLQLCDGSASGIADRLVWAHCNGLQAQHDAAAADDCPRASRVPGSHGSERTARFTLDLGVLAVVPQRRCQSLGTAELADEGLPVAVR